MRRVPFVVIVVLFVTLVGCSIQYYSGTGVVTGRHHANAWPQIIPYMCGKTTCIMIIQHPESWSLDVHQANDEDHTYGVSKAQYETIADGSTITIRNGVVAS